MPVISRDAPSARPTAMGRDRDTHIPAESSRDLLTRRSMLQRTGWMIAAAVPLRMAIAAQDSTPGSAGQSVSPVMGKLSTYMSEARDRKLPDEVVEKAKHHIVDTLAAMVSGSELPPGPAAIRFARAYAGPKSATAPAPAIRSRPTHSRTRDAA